MNSTTYVTLDLQAPNLAVVVAAKQNDTLGRQIAAALRDGSAAFDATGLLCEIRYAKPDGTVGFYDTLEDNTTPAYTIDGNVVTFTLAEQMLTVAGAVFVDVNFYAPTGEKLTAFAFVLQVEASVLADGTIVSSDYYNVLTATLAQAAEIAANLPQPSSGTPVADSASGSAGTGNGFARGNHSHPINVATSGTPANLGTPANGTSAKYARQDHVHQLPSAADLDVHYKIFSEVEQISDTLVTGSATVAGIVSAMPVFSMLLCGIEALTSADRPATTATLEIIKHSALNIVIAAYGRTSSGDGDWRMFTDGSGNPSGTWEKIAGLETGTFVANGNYTLAANNHISVVKSGRIVQISGYIYPTIQAPAFGNLGTVPEGFRPMLGTSIQLIPSGRPTFPYWAFIGYDGSVGIQDVELPPNVNYYVSMTYISS